MPKMKTKKAAAKRFTRTATGEYKRPRAGLRHLLVNRSHKRKKLAGSRDTVHISNKASVQTMLPYA
jgi:large subunit ribosomal protein L35